MQLHSLNAEATEDRKGFKQTLVVVCEDGAARLVHELCHPNHILKAPGAETKGGEARGWLWRGFA